MSKICEGLRPEDYDCNLKKTPRPIEVPKEETSSEINNSKREEIIKKSNEQINEGPDLLWRPKGGRP